MSESCQEKRLSRRIFKQLLSKLNVVKKSKNVEVMNDVETHIAKIETNKPQEGINSKNDIQNDRNYEEENSSDFKTFCKEIEKFENYIKDHKNLSSYIYIYPQILQKQINIDIDELQNSLAEIKETTINIKQLKNQQKLIKKEISGVKRTIRQIRDVETRELESLVARYHKDMYVKWTNAKWKSDALEELLFDVEEKQLALQSLSKLINRYLNNDKQYNSSSSEKSEESSINKNPSIPLISSAASIQSKIQEPLPNPSISTPHPTPLSVNLLNRNNSRLSWVQRRLRAERRGNYATVRPIPENHENEPYVYSFNMNNNNDMANMNSNFNPFEFDTSRFSCESSGTISSEASNGQINSLNNSRETEDDYDVKSDVQSVLQVNI